MYQKNSLRITDSFVSGATFYLLAYFGQGSGPILVDRVTCYGSESRLFSCSHSTPGNDDTHSEDAGVACLPCELVNYYNPLVVTPIFRIYPRFLSGWRCEASWRPVSI